MMSFSKCIDCILRHEAVEDVLSAIRLRRGMSLKSLRGYLFARHGLTFGRVDELVKELKNGGFIEGSAQKFRVSGQGGVRFVQDR
jgi:hypothetical protein